MTSFLRFYIRIFKKNYLKDNVMKKSTYFMSNKPLFSPDMQEMIEQTIELMKLDIVQGLLYEEESSIFAKKGMRKNPSKLGKVVAKHLRNLPRDSKYKREDFSKSLPINRLYNHEVKSLIRKHNINLIDRSSVMRQIDPVKKFSYIIKDIHSSSRISDIHENLFDTEIELDLKPISSSQAMKMVLPHLNVNTGVARILHDSMIWKPDFKDWVIGNPFGGGKGDGNSTSGSGEEHREEPTEEIRLNQGLKFLLHRVKCVDETNPEWPGGDEIAMGGTAVNANAEIRKINEFRVRNGFDDNESKYYSPPKLLNNYNLEKINYPADFLMILALAEKDSGGLSTFITKLWESIKDEVTVIMTSVGAAAGAAAGAAIGGTVGTSIAGPLGAVIGLAAGAILGALVGWLIGVLKDDIFEPKSAALHLPTHDSTFKHGSLKSQTMTLNFRDHGGYYRIYYSWEIVR